MKQSDSGEAMSPVGKVYLVGAGPGDPGLLTLKGQACLAIADLVLYDGLVNPLLLRHTQANAERTCRGGPAARRVLDQDEINRHLVTAAQQGKTVVRLKGGDPFIFGRGSEEAAALAQAGIPFEVVPGITAATAVAEYAGISLTHRDLASAVAFITGHEDPGKPESALDYQVLSRFPGTLVFYMGLHRLERIAALLIQEGKSEQTPVAVISRGTTSRQRTVTGMLGDIVPQVQSARLHAPSLIVVGDCVRQRQQINWFESLPLIGVNIGIPRPENEADSAIDLALSLGANPVVMPAIELSPPEDWGPVDAVLNQLGAYDWILLTSVNGVDAFLRRLWEIGGDARQLATAKLAAIGPATAARLEEYHLRADLIPGEYRGEALATALAPLVSGNRVLWPRASRGRNVIPELLAEAGAQVETVVVYQHSDATALPVLAQKLLDDDELHWVALSSPAIAGHVAQLLGAKAKSGTIRFAAISPVTAAAAREAGLDVSCTATEYTWPGLFAAIRQFVEARTHAESE